MWGESEERPFARSRSASDGEEYPIEDAEAKDLTYLIENTCMTCNQFMKSGTVKIVPPRYFQEHDHYVRKGVVQRRYMCVKCYNSSRSLSPRMRTKQSEEFSDNGFFRSMLSGMMTRR